ncbi:MAG: ROK family transcriptional regulator [Acidobacteria bacterium]|nr:MAG: ROK family transcriptional regulator [Acidobacteriota bacterium]
MRKIDLSNFQIATSGTAREVNRRIVLNLIRAHNAISRADLARKTGLQRSTVSLIIEQLMTEDWVVEGMVGYSARGRKPTYLRLNTERLGVIGVNLRPYSTTIALADLNANFRAQESLPTPPTPELFLREVTRRINNLRQSHSGLTCEGIGVCLPGRVDLGTQKLVFAPNLGWEDVDLKTPLEAATGLPVALENAANACALAEIWFGRSEGVRDLAIVTVSEGIGTGFVLNGQLVTGPTGRAGEFGHVTIDPEGPPCKCGNRGCWEVFASNTATTAYYRQIMPTHRRGHRSNAAIPEPTFEDVLRLAELGDPCASEALERMAGYLGVGVAMVATALEPSLIVLVGEVTRAWSRIGPIIKKTMAERCPLKGATRVSAADDALQPRLRGTVALIIQKHFGAPAVA